MPRRLWPGLGGRVTATGYQILHIEWWSTCCEPHIADSPRDAGGARANVQFLDQRGTPTSYRFDLFTRGGAYWGAAEGYPVRQWALRDVYPSDQLPLYWQMAGGQ